MKRASKIINDEDKAAVNRAVTEAEAMTSAELVPVVATASGRYDRAEDVVGLWLGVAVAAAVWFMFPEGQDQSGGWGGVNPLWKLLAMIAAIVGGFCLGASVGSRVGWLRRLFTPVAQMREEVASKARAMFFDNRIHRTAGATGLLVYVSLYERMATVLADDAIINKLGAEVIDELRMNLTTKLKEGNVAEALCETLVDYGKRLAPVLPRAADDVNELPDALVIVD